MLLYYKFGPAVRHQAPVLLNGPARLAPPAVLHPLLLPVRPRRPLVERLARLRVG